MKLGIVGSGMIVGEFLSFIHEIKDIQLIHISGTQRSEEKLKQIVEQYGFERYSTNYEQLLNDQHVDTIYIALPNHLHFEFAKRALQHHKHYYRKTNDIDLSGSIISSKNRHGKPFVFMGSYYKSIFTSLSIYKRSSS